jgi:hypothetical protein
MREKLSESDSTREITGVAVVVYTVVALALVVFGALLVYCGIFGVGW